jgi:hypothetical protein
MTRSLVTGPLGRSRTRSRARPRAMPRVLVLLAAAIALATLGADCDGNIVQDPTFRDWCGSSLCAWTLDAGRIQRVPTWNADDFGVSFLDPGTEISQVTAENEAPCLLFKTVADIDPAAQMTVLVDFDNDGIIDFQAPLGATDWHEVQAEISAPPAYQGITFHVKKAGTGTAVLAEMQVLSTTGCTPAPALVLPPQVLGGFCTKSTDCQTGMVCNGSSQCAQCDEATPCADGAACTTRIFQAQQCDPGQGLGKTGDPCSLDDDCASGACSGTSVTSLAAVFGVLDAGCPVAPHCDLDAALDSSAAACACFLKHGGTCL